MQCPLSALTRECSWRVRNRSDQGGKSSAVDRKWSVGVRRKADSARIDRRRKVVIAECAIWNLSDCRLLTRFSHCQRQLPGGSAECQVSCREPAARVDRLPTFQAGQRADMARQQLCVSSRDSCGSSCSHHERPALRRASPTRKSPLGHGKHVCCSDYRFLLARMSQDYLPPCPAP